MKSVKSKKPYVWVERPKVISAVRRTFRTYPPYKEVLERCKVEWFQSCKNGNSRRRVSFRCETCGKTVERKKFAVDHTSPVIDPSVGFVDYDTYMSRLFCPITNLTGMCHDCHKTKTNSEGAQRRKTRKERSK